MKIYKPYLSLSKTTESYVLDIVLSTSKEQTITSITQEEVTEGTKTFWGVIITLSTETQLANGPENPIFSTTVKVDLNKSKTYKTIRCIVHQTVESGKYKSAKDEESDVDFIDGVE